MVMMLTRMDDGEVKRLSLFGRVRRGGRASDTGIVVFLDDLIKIRYSGGGYIRFTNHISRGPKSNFAGSFADAAL